MQLLHIKTPIIKEGDDLASVIAAHADIEDQDIIVISSKVIARSEGAAIHLNAIDVTDEGREWASKCGRSPEFRQAVLNETARMNGTVLGGCANAMLTELKPDGLREGSLLVANAGLDESNIEEGLAIGWPRDPVISANTIKQALQGRAVLITDSCCRPRRIGVTAITLVTCGIDPLESQKGKKDLFSKELKMTREARADQLATAANFLMGNADESIPAVIIRDHGLPFSDFCGWVPAIEPQEDLFAGIL